MKNTFKQYHQFSEKEFKKIWDNCLFVFDTNTLLNMYRYSRNTVNTYFKVLDTLRAKKQLWIPYQVGHEFYENRVDVISEYEGSYDSVLSILDKAKKDIEESYKNHPFLDLKEIKASMDAGLKNVETEIRNSKKNHPKWMEKDDVLEEINNLFQGNIGIGYSEERLAEIKAEGKNRYAKKVPPGYRDDKKPEDKKYGDLILWYQTIDKAKESKKPIILISGDVKEDWWLEKNGNRIMPLPQLKKEMLEKAGVDFHIYTADRFLEFYAKETDDFDKSTISEVRKIRELEEQRMTMRRKEISVRERDLSPRVFEKNLIEYLNLCESLERLLTEVNRTKIHPRYGEEVDRVLYRLRTFRNKVVHGDLDRRSFHEDYISIKASLYIFDGIISSEEIEPESLVRIREVIYRIDRLGRF